jgi:hypothetical protein
VSIYDIQQAVEDGATVGVPVVMAQVAHLVDDQHPPESDSKREALKQASNCGFNHFLTAPPPSTGKNDRQVTVR